MISISAIIPAYNSEDTIAATIDSALAQDYPNLELIVVDDGSTDSTPRILNRYLPRIRVILQSNRGPSAARNAGAAVASGELLAFLDADDLWLPGKLAKSVNALRMNPHAILVFSDVISLCDDGVMKQPILRERSPAMRDLLNGGWTILPSAVVMRRATFVAAGGFAEEFKRPGGDDPFMWLVAREYGEFAYLREPVVIHRVAPVGSLADKYRSGVPVFIRLVRERYGLKSRALVKQVYREFAAYTLAKASYQLDAGDLKGAGRSLLEALWTSPRHVLHSGIVPRFFRTRNLGRLRTIMARNAQ
jgi:glycosyltransferase involved in cell wall biosynthesis